MAEKEKIADKIRKMSQILDEEHIARALGIQTEIVRGILSGNIPDSALKDYNPANPPDVRIVEKKKFVRSKLVGVFSTGGCGATTLTASLAVLSAKRSGQPVAVVDLNEFSSLGHALGLDVSGEQAAFFPNVLWWGSSETKDTIVQHPGIKNLNIVFGAATTERYIELKHDVINKALGDIAGLAAMTWVDCPLSPVSWKSIAPVLDMIVFVLRPDMISLASFWQGLYLLKEWEDKIAIVVNGVDKESLSESDCRRTIRDITNAPVLAFLPFDPDVKRCSNNQQCCALNQSPYTESLDDILAVLWPDVSPQKAKQGNMFESFAKISGIFRKG